jgi:hypothetical protein
MVSGDFDAGRHWSIRVDGELNGRLAAPRSQAPEFYQQALSNQFVDDVCDRLSRKVRLARDLRAPQLPMRAHNLKHHATIVRAIAFGVAANGNARSAALIFICGHAALTPERRGV